MPKITYIEKRFQEKTLNLISVAESIIEEYQEQGFDLTLRQLYYQFVSRDLLPNTNKSYDMLGSVINNARLAGLIDWNSIVDRTRNVEINSHWNSPAEIVRACARQYQVDKWAGQIEHVEVWIEKDALKGVIEDVCRRLDVPYFSCRGYVSQSEMWEAGASRLSDYDSNIILHLGDHDPSGVDMTRDIEERLTMFCTSPVYVERIALNMDQIEEYNPPPNPAKLTDSRCRAYVELYGDKSWELDALEPSVMVELIETNIRQHMDADLFQRQSDLEESHRDMISDVADSMEDGS